MGLLRKDQLIDAVFCPEMEDGSCAGGSVGFDRVTEIRIDELPGPMGPYLVAVITRRVEDSVDIVPLHAAEIIRTMPREDV